MQLFTLAFLLIAQLVSGHFELTYPNWRGDSFLPPASQYMFPCANVNTTDASNNNRTLWPLDGGSLKIEFHHSWTYVAFNLGLGSNTNTFNISLNPMLLNETGNGTMCFPKWRLPADLNIEDGTDASLQIITIGDSGTALYNCADIRFSADATLLSEDQCQNTTGLELYPLVQQQADGSMVGAAATVTVTASAAGASATGESAAMGMSAPGLSSLALGAALTAALLLGS
ncbi:hypothetical protein A1O7_02671 [Cladophialophora yegresii CBS 114405]|uniref:Copper acquisition factor BIM1-like domain-containing protein n=1 Tax=Cladophialophora yegresii CBS 114405 TaxID=1182544 RepID=W9W2P4_9EURO|nr:uncharacterized protein A1O7_02671 [Cladophialophora yegresii CBS 114405]EXJ62238.1 hypothetical protein A1O7_02671 [Cladophialophora yegresii CBS 114405]